MRNQPVGVQAAIISGVCAILVAIISGFFLIYNNKNSSSEKISIELKNHKSPTQNINDSINVNKTSPEGVKEKLASIELIQFTNADKSHYKFELNKISDNYVQNIEQSFNSTPNRYKIDSILESMEYIKKFHFAPDYLGWNENTPEFRSIIFDASFHNKGEGKAILNEIGVKVWYTYPLWEAGDVHSSIMDGYSKTYVLDNSFTYGLNIENVQEMLIHLYDVEGYAFINNLGKFYENASPLKYTINPPLVIPKYEPGRINIEFNTNPEYDEYSGNYLLQFEFYFTNNSTVVKSDVFEIEM